MNRLSFVLVGAVLTGSLAAACGNGETTDGEAAGAEEANQSPEPTGFETAHRGCVSMMDRIELGDEGTSIIADGPPDDLFRASDQFIQETACVLGALDVPDYVVEQMDSTTSLQGLREAEWNGIEASWSYHPDNGFDLVLRDTQASAISPS